MQLTQTVHPDTSGIDYSAVVKGKSGGSRRGKRKEAIQREKRAKPCRILLPTGKCRSVITASGQGSLLFHPHQPLLPVTTQPPMVLSACAGPGKAVRYTLADRKQNWGMAMGCDILVTQVCKSDSLHDLCSYMVMAGLMRRFCKKRRKINFYSRIQRHWAILVPFWWTWEMRNLIWYSYNMRPKLKKVVLKHGLLSFVP